MLQVYAPCFADFAFGACRTIDMQRVMGQDIDRLRPVHRRQQEEVVAHPETVPQTELKVSCNLVQQNDRRATTLKEQKGSKQATTCHDKSARAEAEFHKGSPTCCRVC
jgi:hypothetical protein